MQLKYEEDLGTFNVTEDSVDKVEAKYMFLTETLGWREGVGGKDVTPSDADPKYVTKRPHTCA